MNVANKLNLSLLLGIVLISGCATTTDESAPARTDISRSERIEFFDENQKPNYEQQIRNRLDAFYSEWKGTPYRFGGNSKNGIDCSAFIQIMMAQVFDMEVPRTTILQAQKGSQIDRKSAKFGDLVFFKTGRNQRHVGLYLGDGQFMHASSSKGVMISSVDNVYWRKHIWHYRTYSAV